MKKPTAEKSKKNAISEHAQKFVEDYELLKRMALIASGAPVEYVRDIIVDGKVEKLYRPASIHDQLLAINYLLDRGYGKPAQLIESNSVDKFLEEFRRRFA